MENKLDSVKNILKKYNQEHLIHFYNELNAKQQEKLLNQILSIDFDIMQKLYESSKNNINETENKIEPIEYSIKDRLTKQEEDRYLATGVDAIKSGKIAVCHMAGGQRYKTRPFRTKGNFCNRCKSA